MFELDPIRVCISYTSIKYYKELFQIGVMAEGRAQWSNYQIHAGFHVWNIINVCDVAINLIYVVQQNEGSLVGWTCGNLKLLISCEIIIQPPFHHLKQDQILMKNKQRQEVWFKIMKMILWAIFKRIIKD